MKIKLVFLTLLVSASLTCSQSNATDLLQRLLGRGGCGCEAPACVEEVASACGCDEEVCDDSCIGTPGRLFGNCRGGLLGQLLQGCGRECSPAPAITPVVEATCDCGDTDASCQECQRQPVRGLIGELRQRWGTVGRCDTAPADGFGCGPTPIPEPSCSCDQPASETTATSEKDSCCGGRFNGGLLGRLTGRCNCGRQKSCGPAPAPAIADESCGCDDAETKSCGCGARKPVRGLLNQLRSRSICGCGETPSCGCEQTELPAADCGCEQPAEDCKCHRRLKGCCSDCGANSCDGGCRALALLDRLKGDRCGKESDGDACSSSYSNSECGCRCSAGSISQDAGTISYSDIISPVNRTAVRPPAPPVAKAAMAIPALMKVTAKTYPTVDPSAFKARR